MYELEYGTICNLSCVTMAMLLMASLYKAANKRVMKIRMILRMRLIYQVMVRVPLSLGKCGAGCCCARLLPLGLGQCGAGCCCARLVPLSLGEGDAGCCCATGPW